MLTGVELMGLMLMGLVLIRLSIGGRPRDDHLDNRMTYLLGR
jgi:hypothetical protein